MAALYRRRSALEGRVDETLRPGPAGPLPRVERRATRLSRRGRLRSLRPSRTPPHRRRQVELRIERSLALADALALSIDGQCHGPRLDGSGADETEIVESCRAAGSLSCVWDCTLGGIRLLAIRRFEWLVALVEQVAAHPECESQLGTPAEALTCLGIDPANAGMLGSVGASSYRDPETGAIRVHSVEVIARLHDGLAVQLRGALEDGGCGSGQVLSMALLP